MTPRKPRVKPSDIDYPKMSFITGLDAITSLMHNLNAQLERFEEMNTLEAKEFRKVYESEAKKINNNLIALAIEWQQYPQEIKSTNKMREIADTYAKLKKEAKNTLTKGSEIIAKDTLQEQYERIKNETSKFFQAYKRDESLLLKNPLYIYRQSLNNNYVNLENNQRKLEAIYSAIKKSKQSRHFLKQTRKYVHEFRKERKAIDTRRKELVRKGAIQDMRDRIGLIKNDLARLKDTDSPFNNELNKIDELTPDINTLENILWSAKISAITDDHDALYLKLEKKATSLVSNLSNKHKNYAAGIQSRANDLIEKIETLAESNLMGPAALNKITLALTSFDLMATHLENPIEYNKLKEIEDNVVQLEQELKNHIHDVVIKQTTLNEASLNDIDTHGLTGENDKHLETVDKLYQDLNAIREFQYSFSPATIDQVSMESLVDHYQRVSLFTQEVGALRKSISDANMQYANELEAIKNELMPRSQALFKYSNMLKEDDIDAINHMMTELKQHDPVSVYLKDDVSYLSLQKEHNELRQLQAKLLSYDNLINQRLLDIVLDKEIKYMTFLMKMSGDDNGTKLYLRKLTGAQDKLRHFNKQASPEHIQSEIKTIKDTITPNIIKNITTRLEQFIKDLSDKPSETFLEPFLIIYNFSDGYFNLMDMNHPDCKNMMDKYDEAKKLVEEHDLLLSTHVVPRSLINLKETPHQLSSTNTFFSHSKNASSDKKTESDKDIDDGTDHITNKQ